MATLYLTNAGSGNPATPSTINRSATLVKTNIRIEIRSISIQDLAWFNSSESLEVHVICITNYQEFLISGKFYKLSMVVVFFYI